MDKEKEKEEINRIVIYHPEGKTKVFGDLKKCPICNINFSAITPCIVCELRIKKEKELGRKLTKQEFRELMAWLD